MSGHLNRMLWKRDIRGINLTPKKIFNCLRPVKDDMGLKKPGVYCIPCKCSKVYVGQFGRTIEWRVEEHRRHIRHSHSHELAVAKHNTHHDHKIRFQETQILASKSGYMDKLIREVRELDLHPNNINWEDELPLSKTWKLAVQQLRRKRLTSMPNWCSTTLPFLTTPFSSVNSSTGRMSILHQPPSSRFLCSPNNLRQVLLKSDWPLLHTADSAHTHPFHPYIRWHPTPLLIYSLTYDHWRWDPQRLLKHRWEICLAHRAKSPKPRISNHYMVKVSNQDCWIFISLEFSRQIFQKSLKYQISLKSVQWELSCSMRTDGQTW
jgi:hypothetical protein